MQKSIHENINREELPLITAVVFSTLLIEQNLSDQNIFDPNLEDTHWWEGATRKNDGNNQQSIADNQRINGD